MLHRHSPYLECGLQVVPLGQDPPHIVLKPCAIDIVGPGPLRVPETNIQATEAPLHAMPQQLQYLSACPDVCPPSQPLQLHSCTLHIPRAYDMRVPQRGKSLPAPPGPKSQASAATNAATCSFYLIEFANSSCHCALVHSDGLRARVLAAPTTS